MQRIVVADRAAAADNPATTALGRPADTMTLEELIAEITALGRPADTMTTAALNHIVVGIAAAAPGMAVDTSAAGGMVVVGTVVTCWLLLCTASIPIYLVLS